MLNEISEYLDSKNLKYKIVGEGHDSQFLLDICPFCHDKKGTHFYISTTTGQFYCHKCGNAGSLLTLKRHFGDTANVVSLMKSKEDFKLDDSYLNEVNEAHINLMQDKEVIFYLYERKFSTSAIKNFKLGLTYVEGKKYLVIPTFVQGNLVNIKYRSLPPEPKKFFRVKGGKSELFNADVLDDRSYTTIFICEGETDTIALWSQGVKNVVGVTNGAQGIKPEWIDKLDKYQRIYLVFDNDDAGYAGATKFATRLGVERCFLVKLPIDINDVNQFFMNGHTKEEFDNLVEQAKPCDIENVKSLFGVLQDVLRNAVSSNRETRIELPWDNLNKLLNGFVAGDLIVIAGKPGVGKSTFSFNILYHLARIGKPVLLFSLEMPPWRILPRLVSLHKRIDSKLCENIDILASVSEDFASFPFYIAYKYDKPNWNFISDTIRQCVRRYGIQFVVFDNLHFLCRSIGHQTEEVSTNIQNFKLLAEELSIPIAVIARPRKTNAKVISGVDLKDSADIEGDADIIIILARERKQTVDGEDVEGVFDPKTLVVVDKCRYSAGGATFLLARDNEARFDQL